MRAPLTDRQRLRAYRNTKLYRPLTRTLRVYNRVLIAGLHERGFTERQFAEIVGERDFDRIRHGLLTIADRLDPDGAFGSADETRKRP